MIYVILLLVLWIIIGFGLVYLLNDEVGMFFGLVLSIIITGAIVVLANEYIPAEKIIKHKQIYKVEKATLSGEGVSVLYKTDYVECTKYCPVYIKSNRNEIEIVNITQKGVWDWFVCDKEKIIFYGEIN